MRILFITDLYPVKEDEKETPRTLYNFVREWEKLGHEVNVIKPNWILNSFLRGKPFYPAGRYSSVYNLNFWLPFIGKLPDFGGYDLTVAHMPSGILFADKLGAPFVAGIHNSDLEVLTKTLYKFYFKPRLLQALRNAKAIACRSPVIRNRLLGLYPEFEGKTFVAASGISVKYIFSDTCCAPLSLQMCPQKYTLPKSLKVLTVANNRKKRKNIDKVVKACKGLDGFELRVIRGGLAQEEVFEAMRDADIFILPSTGETFGMVYLEAMACGCITVCTKNDGIDGIIRDGENGFTVEPDVGKISELLVKIKNLSDNEISELLKNACSTVQEYTQEKCAANYLQQILNFSKI